MHTIGVIGLGSIGKRHAHNLLKLGHAVIVQDVDEYAVKSLIGVGAKAVGDVDAYVIAAPTEHHLPIHDELTSSSSRSKPIFMEKPLGHMMPLTTEQIIMVGYNLRFHHCVKKAKEWLDAGRIGAKFWGRFTCAQYNARPAYMRDGVILNWSHEIDLALYLMGDCKVMTSVTAVQSGKDYMSDMIISHVNGSTSTIHLDYLTKPEVRGFTISGELGNISVNLTDRTARLDSVSGQLSFGARDNFDENYVDEMKAFIDRLDGKEAIGATAAEAVKVMDVCLMARKQAGL